MALAAVVIKGLSENVESHENLPARVINHFSRDDLSAWPHPFVAVGLFLFPHSPHRLQNRLRDRLAFRFPLRFIQNTKLSLHLVTSYGLFLSDDVCFLLIKKL